MLMRATMLESPGETHALLMAGRAGDPIEDLLARMLSSWSCGVGCMPDWFGLGEAGFEALMARHFPRYDATWLLNPGRPLDQDRVEERADLLKLLIDNRSGRSPSEGWLAQILVVGCQGSDHLWQDLGLWQRADLSRLMLEHFTPLAQRNDKDMKWKKFLYKQLCEAEGIYVCRAPSCEVCTDYSHCFGSEE